MFNDGVYCFLFCFGTVQPVTATPPIDTFCTVYQRQVLTKDELSAVKALPKTVRTRMQYNDLYYLCKCKGWESKECASIQR